MQPKAPSPKHLHTLNLQIAPEQVYVFCRVILEESTFAASDW